MLAPLKHVAPHTHWEWARARAAPQRTRPGPCAHASRDPCASCLLVACNTTPDTGRFLGRQQGKAESDPAPGVGDAAAAAAASPGLDMRQCPKGPAHTTAGGHGHPPFATGRSAVACGVRQGVSFARATNSARRGHQQGPRGTTHHCRGAVCFFRERHVLHTAAGGLNPRSTRWQPGLRPASGLSRRRSPCKRVRPTTGSRRCHWRRQSRVRRDAALQCRHGAGGAHLHARWRTSLADASGGLAAQHTRPGRPLSQVARAAAR